MMPWGRKRERYEKEKAHPVGLSDNIRRGTERGRERLRQRSECGDSEEPLVKMEIAFFRCGCKQARFWSYLDAYFSLQNSG